MDKVRLETIDRQYIDDESDDYYRQLFIKGLRCGNAVMNDLLDFC